MKVEATKVPVDILRGARIAYNLDNPPAFGRSFEDWLGSTIAVTRAKGQSELVHHLEMLCGRAELGESRQRLDQLSDEDQRAVLDARQAFLAVRELEELAALSLRRTDGEHAA